MNCARQTITSTSQRLVSPEGGGSTNSSGRSDVGTLVTRVLRRGSGGGSGASYQRAERPLRPVLEATPPPSGTLSFDAHCGCGEIGIHAAFRSPWGQPRGGSNPLSRIVQQRGRCYAARRFLPLSSRGLGRRPLTAETGVRIPVAVPLDARLHGGFRRSGGGATNLRSRRTWSPFGSPVTSTSGGGACRRCARRFHHRDVQTSGGRPRSATARR